MPTPLQRLGCVFSLVLLTALAGCESPPHTFEIATTINSDGSCRRSIYQPKEGYLPLEAISMDWIGQWESISGATAPSDKFPPSQRLSGLELACAKYFVAEGTFPSPHDIPVHYRYVAKGAGASELARDYNRTDFGLLVEYRWSETLTNSVTPDRFLAARDDLLDLLLPIVIRAMERRFGEEYDVAGLSDYLGRDGRKFAEEASVFLYMAAAQHMSDKQGQLAGERLLRRHGVEFAVKSDWSNDEASAEFERAIERFTVKIVSTHVKRRDGRPLSEAEAKQFLEKILEPRDPPAAAKSNNIASQMLDEPLDPATEAWIDEYLPQIMGVYPWLRIFGGREEFEFSLRLSGRVVETNGLLHEDGHVSWKFNSGDAYPTGYSMTARSLDIQAELQRKVFGGVRIASVSDGLKFIELVGRDGELLDAVREVCRSGKIDTLRDLKAKSPAELKRLNAVRSMLHIESDGKRDAG